MSKVIERLSRVKGVMFGSLKPLNKRRAILTLYGFGKPIILTIHIDAVLEFSVPREQVYDRLAPGPAKPTPNYGKAKIIKKLSKAEGITFISLASSWNQNYAILDLRWFDKPIRLQVNIIEAIGCDTPKRQSKTKRQSHAERKRLNTNARSDYAPYSPRSSSNLAKESFYQSQYDRRDGGRNNYMFRDVTGRFMSSSLYDDYSDESFPD